VYLTIGAGWTHSILIIEIIEYIGTASPD
jgi:hypothetical protein